MYVFFVKQKTAYEMRISDWSSDVCSADLQRLRFGQNAIEFCHLRHRREEIMIRQDEAQGRGDVRNLVCKIEKSGRIRALVGEAAVPIPRFSFAEGPKMFKIGSRQVFTRDVDVARLLAFRPIPLVVRQSLLKGSDVAIASAKIG